MSKLTDIADEFRKKNLAINNDSTVNQFDAGSKEVPGEGGTKTDETTRENNLSRNDFSSVDQFDAGSREIPGENGTKTDTTTRTKNQAANPFQPGGKEYNSGKIG